MNESLPQVGSALLWAAAYGIKQASLPLKFDQELVGSVRIRILSPDAAWYCDQL